MGLGLGLAYVKFSTRKRVMEEECGSRMIVECSSDTHLDRVHYTLFEHRDLALRLVLHDLRLRAAHLCVDAGLAHHAVGLARVHHGPA